MQEPTYENKKDHRSPGWDKSKKSKWIIPVEEEKKVFLNGYNAKWFQGETLWSLKSNNSTLDILGQDHRTRYVPKGKQYIELVLAKFVKHRENCWHGYPVNVLTDSPCSEILKAWRNTPGIPKKEIMKLNRAK
ncbi:hypothetical protein [Pectobacterium brasiliense]|uniref:hypothetical protein n=1 Tax=Pectobacterium brasiliense TaxID=180957 RepID=UPI001968C775|nr:hypothetical protein [Pectobacterium brasiliense]MBN3227495.1 hypothetical protein [Pectobacterium brasiliense]